MRLRRGLEATLEDAPRERQQLAFEPLLVRRLVDGDRGLVGALEEAVGHLDDLRAGSQCRERVDQPLRRVARGHEPLGILVAERVALPVDDERARALLRQDVHHAVDQQAPAAGTTEDWVGKLAAPATAPDLDLAALRQAALARIKSRAKTDAAPLKRPPIAPELLKLPQLAADIQFDEDAAVVRPESYQVLGRIADTLSHPSLLGYKFLIMGHTISTGRRENNLTLSQR